MPDLVQFSIVRLANANLNVPRWRVEGKIIDSKTGALVQDFTGAGAVTFPNVLGNLSTARQDEWVAEVMQDLIRRRFGI